MKSGAGQKEWRGGLDRGSVENRCNQPRTLCFNSLHADVCLRSGTFLHFSSIYTHVCVHVHTHICIYTHTRAHSSTVSPPATVHLRVHVHVRVHHVDRHVAGYYRSSVSHGHSCSNAIAYSRLFEAVNVSLSLSIYFLWIITELNVLFGIIFRC